MADEVAFQLPTLLQRQWQSHESGRAWLEALPSIVARSAHRWGLGLNVAWQEGARSLVVPVDLSNGDEAVLKVTFPDPHQDREADALAHWAGQGAVRLLDSYPADRAMLIERCQPGDQLWSIEDDGEATRMVAGVMRRIWKPAPVSHPFRTLADEAWRWAAKLPGDYEAAGAPYERSLMLEAVEILQTLAVDQGQQVVVHQDLHGGNILRASREPWLVIDPQPLVGEREFDVASLLRDRRELLAGPDGRRIVQRRFDILAEELSLDRRRMRDWGVAHALAWGVSGSEGNELMFNAARLIRACS